jgi:hypothetical protein
MLGASFTLNLLYEDRAKPGADPGSTTWESTLVGGWQRARCSGYQVSYLLCILRWTPPRLSLADGLDYMYAHAGRTIETTTPHRGAVRCTTVRRPVKSCWELLTDSLTAAEGMLGPVMPADVRRTKPLIWHVVTAMGSHHVAPLSPPLLALFVMAINDH